MAKPKKKKRRTNNGTAYSIKAYLIDFLIAIISQVVAAYIIKLLGI